MKKIFLSSVLVLGLMSGLGFTASAKTAAKPQQKEIYEWRIYTLTSADGTALDEFFKTTLIPAFARQGVKVGAFKPYKAEEKPSRYLLFVYPSLDAYHKAKTAIWKDAAFAKAAQPFFDKTAPSPLYTDFTAWLCEAFDRIPQMKTPDKNRSLFEFRRYHSPNEEANRRKIKMFNVDEIPVFDKTGINSVCYGEILAGADMPAIIYLTWYRDEPTRNEAWSRFVNHPDWKRISKLPEYAYTAVRNTVVLLSPLDYSQF